MKKEVFITADGSHSISVPALNASYHSTYGALQESRHIFIEAGLKPLLVAGNGDIAVLEIGFGTGLNALLTLLETKNLPVTLYYEAIEAYPVEPDIVRQLNYPRLLGEQAAAGEVFLQLHLAPWNSPYTLLDRFRLHKRAALLEDAATVLSRRFNLIYFDAFAPEVQPELWTKNIFDRLYASLDPGGVVVTYCSKSVVRRTLTAAGFLVEKLPGPKGKREIVRARKI